MKWQKLILGLLSAALLATACAAPRVFVNKDADFGFYERVAVLPFSNLSADRNATEKVTSSFVTELLIGDEAEIAPMGDIWKAFKSIVKEDRFNLPDQLTADEAKEIGAQTKVQGIFVGSVRDYGMIRAGQEEFPLVSIAIRFFDCQSGIVVWSCEITKKGGPKFPIFSFGETHTLGEMTTKVCREAAQTFLNRLK